MNDINKIKNKISNNICFNYCKNSGNRIFLCILKEYKIELIEYIIKINIIFDINSSRISRLFIKDIGLIKELTK